MTLSKLSLNQNGTKDNPSNKDIKVYIEPGTEDDCPSLHITDFSIYPEFSLYLFRNSFIQVVRDGLSTLF